MKNQNAPRGNAVPGPSTLRECDTLLKVVKDVAPGILMNKPLMSKTHQFLLCSSKAGSRRLKDELYSEYKAVLGAESAGLLFEMVEGLKWMMTDHAFDSFEQLDAMMQAHKAHFHEIISSELETPPLPRRRGKEKITKTKT
jgi:hypothetical protein